MARRIAYIAIVALAAPSFAMAQRYEEHYHRGGPPPGEFREPHYGGPSGRFLYHGRPFNSIHAPPFVYPHGWAYRRWVVGATLPPLLLAPAYYYSGWASLGLSPPQPGFQWVRYGPDLLLVNTVDGQVVEVVYGVFY
jgi:hypothetical protein